MPELSKLQIRAKVMAAVSDIKTVKEPDAELLKKIIDDLSSVDNKEVLFDIFLKEYIKAEEKEYTLMALVLKELVPSSRMEEKSMEIIQSPSYSDEIKYKLVQLLRLSGVPRDYDIIPSYFENPDKVLDMETKKLLETAVFNPESMLDFLDFISAVSTGDRKVLINSLGNDYQGDELANILYPVLYSDFEDDLKLDVVNILADSKSSLAIPPFEYLIETSLNEDIIKATGTGLKKLKLAGCTKEKAEQYFKNMIKDTECSDFYTTIPDGAGNQAFLISRKTRDEKYLLAAIVTNDITGIRDTFGFYNITQDEILKLTARFYQSEGKYKITPEYAKYRINKAVRDTIKLKRTFPYEFICWTPVLSDIESDAFLNETDGTDKKYEISEIAEVLTKDFAFRWYITDSDDIHIKTIFEDFYASSSTDIDDINKAVHENFDEIFTEEKQNVWKDRLKNTAYLLYCDGSESESESEILNFIAWNEEAFDVFKFILMQRSIFNYVVALSGREKESFNPVNIFRKNSEKEVKHNKKRLDEIILLLKNNWISEE